MFFIQLDHFHQFIGSLIGVVQIGQKLQKGVSVTQTPQHAAAQILEHTELGKNIGDLKTAAQTHAVDLKRFFPIQALTVQKYIAAGGFEAATDQVEQGRFSSAIRANNADPLALRHRQINATNDGRLAKTLAQVL